MAMGSADHFDQMAADWDSEPRRVALMKAIGQAVLRESAPVQNKDVLDYGCGTGLIGLYLHPHVRSVTGADNSPGMLAELQRKMAAGELTSIRAIQLDLEHDPIPADRYDLVVVGMALHHIANTGRVLHAFYELLRPGGLLCLADLDTEPGTFHGPDMDDVVQHHGFDRQQLAQQLAAIGFTNMRDQTVFTVRKPVEGQGEQDFPVFLLCAHRP